jgi:hypothetical protein
LQAAVVSSAAEEIAAKYTLVWYCIDALLSTARVESDPSRLHRLNLMLISGISSVPLVLLLRTLEEVHQATRNTKQAGLRQELITALFSEIMEKVGDHEKELAMGWWLEHWEDLKRLVLEADGLSASGLSRL